MAHKKKPSGPGPVPPGNQPQAGPPLGDMPEGQHGHEGRSTGAAASQEKDPGNRQGRYQGTGELAVVQPDQNRGDKA